MNSGLYSTVVLSKNNQNSQIYGENLDLQLRKIADKLYIKLCSQQLTQDQMKIQFSKQILTLVLSSFSQVNSSQNLSQFSPDYFSSMDQVIGENISFLKTVYPKMKAYKGKNNFIQHFKSWDQSDKIEFDFLVNMGINFSASRDQYNNKQTRESQNRIKKPQRSKLLEQIQFLLNKIIISAEEAIPQFNNFLRSTLPNQLPRRFRETFNQTVKDVRKFQVDLLMREQSNKLFNKQLIHQNLSIDSFGLFQVLEKWIGQLETMINQPQQYLSCRNYLKILSGSTRNNANTNQVKSMKIFGRKSNISQSSISQSWKQINLFGELPENRLNEEIKEQRVQNKQQQSLFEFILNGFSELCRESNELQGFDYMNEQRKKKFTDKRSAALWGQSKAIKTKIETISSQIQKINQNRKKYSNFAYRNSGYSVAKFSETIKDIGYRKNYEAFAIKQISSLQSKYSQNQKIVKKNNIRQKYTETQKLIYSFAQNSYDFIQQMLIDKLIVLITIILQYQEKLKTNSSPQVSVLSDLELFSLRLKDMISCSLIGDQDLIKQLYKVMMELNSSNKISIMKVDNRLDSVNKDIFILFNLYGNPITCSLKLILQYKDAIVQTKQVASQMLYNFFDQIQSSSYGPLSYISYVLASMDHRIKYLEKIKKFKVAPKTPLNKLCHCGKGAIPKQSSFYIFEKQIKNLINEKGQIQISVYKNMLCQGFVCGICEKAIKKGDNVLPVQKCSQCEYAICVDCAFSIYRQHSLKTYLTLLASVTRIIDEQTSTTFILQNSVSLDGSDLSKKQSNQIKINLREKKTKNNYNILLQGKNIVKYEKNDRPQQFWKRVRDKIELRKLPSYENKINQQEYAAIILRPRQLLRKKGTPFVFISYNNDKKFGKFKKKSGNSKATTFSINQMELQLQQNDFFIPIVRLKKQDVVLQYIAKVLQTNPFCKKTFKEQQSQPVLSYSPKQKYQQISIEAEQQVKNEPIKQQISSDLMHSSSLSNLSKSAKKIKVTKPRFSSNKLIR